MQGGSADESDRQDHPLVIDLALLRRKGVDRHPVAADLDREWVQQALTGTDATVEEASRVELEMLLQPDGVVLVTGRLSSAFQVPCARCLQPAVVDAGTDLCLTYLPPAHGRAEALLAVEEDGELALEEEDLDTFVMRGPLLDLRGAIAEQIAVAYPMRVLCARKDACRGLCTGCGFDLNTLGPEATACGECGLPLHQVSHAPADREAGADDAEEPAWKQALRGLWEKN